MFRRILGTPALLLRPALVLGCALCLAGARGYQLSSDPAVSFLPAGGEGSWIVADIPFELHAIGTVHTQIVFGRSFSTTTEVVGADLTLRAMRAYTVFLDDQEVGRGGGPDASWRSPSSIPLPATIPPGEHLLTIAVENWLGPPAVAAYSKSLDLRTGADWSFAAGTRWVPARLADHIPKVSFNEQLPKMGDSLVAVAPWLLPLLLLSLLWTYEPRSGRAEWASRWLRAPTPGQLRWIVILLWVALCTNNLFALSSRVGFDVRGHLRYVHWITVNRSLPLATDGWQMFQAPLYYVVAAPVMGLLRTWTDAEGVARALRVIPLLCGVVQIEILLRVARAVFPRRYAVQRVTVLVGGLLPMHIYMSQMVGNEPLAGVLTSALILLLIRLLTVEHLVGWRGYAAVGGMWGAAVLAKSTAVLMGPALLATAAVHFAKTRARPAQWLARSGTVLGTALLVGGWYYLRNCVELGAPFVGGWDPSRGIQWWQDPGYRTWSQLTSFGAALEQPIYAATSGFWDALYSTMWLDGFVSSRVDPAGFPPWNMSPLIAGAVLGLAPAAMILSGMLRAIVGRVAEPAAPLGLAAFCVATYIAVMLDLFVRLPIYSTVKATYMLGLLPCFAILAAAGFEPLQRSPVARAIGGSLLVCWAAVAYAAYWV